MAKWYPYERVLTHFLRTTRRVYTVDHKIDADPADIWTHLSDPTSWTSWFPGVIEATVLPDANTGTSTALSVESRLFARIKRASFETEVIEWEPPFRFAWTVRRSTVPWAHAQVDEFEIVELPDGVHLRWTTALAPRFAMRSPVIMRMCLRKRLWRKATEALELLANSAVASPLEPLVH